MFLREWTWCQNCSVVIFLPWAFDYHVDVMYYYKKLSQLQCFPESPWLSFCLCEYAARFVNLGWGGRSLASRVQALAHLHVTLRNNSRYPISMVSENWFRFKKQNTERSLRSLMSSPQPIIPHFFPPLLTLKKTFFLLSSEQESRRHSSLNIWLPCWCNLLQKVVWNQMERCGRSASFFPIPFTLGAYIVSSSPPRYET
jgi:hypothetical protein